MGIPARTVAAWTLLLAVCAGSAVAGRLCYLGRPFDSDAAMFIYMGRLVAEGGGVGRDLVDNKFPTVGLMTSGPWRALGTSWPAYVGLGMAMSLVATLAIGAAAGRGRIAAMLFAVVFLNLTPAVFGGFQLETPIACFASLAAMGAVRAIGDESASGAFVAGLCAGCAALLKPTGVGVLAAMGMGVIVRQHWPLAASQTRGRGASVKLAIGMSAGLAIPLSAAAVYLTVADLWGELPVTAARLSAYAHGSVFDAASWIKLATVGALVGFPIVVRAVVRRSGREELPAKAAKWPCAIVRRPLLVTHEATKARRPAEGGRFGRRPSAGRDLNLRVFVPSCETDVGWRGRAQRSVAGSWLEVHRRLPAVRAARHRARPFSPAVLTFAWSWLAIEFLAVVAQRRMYAYHFLPIVPPAALLFGLMPRPVRPWSLLAALGPAAALGFVVALHVIATPTDDRLAVGRYLLARTSPGDSVWADDWPRLLLETGRRPGSRQALTFLFANDDATAGADSAQIVADLTARRPAVVVLPADLDRWLGRQTGGIVELSQNPTRAAAYVAGWRRIERYTLGHYRREATVGGDAVNRRDDEVVTADVR